jgi:CubicO group peptidase (beta-lactamase class C family)
VTSFRYALLALGLSSAVAFAGAEASASPPAPTEKIDQIFAPVAGKDLPGAAVVVVKDGIVVHSKAYGLSSIELGVPNTTRTKFRLASVSKSFTALAVLRLVEQGRLHLDDPLARYVPDFVGGDQIKIHHLLTHTAGLPDFVSFEEASRMPRDSAPGERLNYSNIGYLALGRVIEKVTGQSYESDLREAIFAPLGMNDTGVDRRPALEKGRASGYVIGPEGALVNAEYSDTASEPAAGGLYSTAEDMTRWIQALLAGRIVSPATFEEATTPVTLADGHRGGYGYGFMLAPFRGLREVAHGGDISGFNTYFALYPEERLAVVVLSNVGMRPPGPLPTAGDLVHRIVELMAGDRLGPEWPEVVKISTSLLDRYVGRYRLEVPPAVAAVMGDAVEISREGGRVFAEAKQTRVELFAESETAFFAKEGPGVRITFTPAAEGAAREGVLSLMGLREFRLRRLPCGE